MSNDDLSSDPGDYLQNEELKPRVDNTGHYYAASMGCAMYNGETSTTTLHAMGGLAIHNSGGEWVGFVGSVDIVRRVWFTGYIGVNCTINVTADRTLGKTMGKNPKRQRY